MKKIAENTIKSCKKLNDQFEKKDYEKDKLELAVDSLIFDLSGRRGLKHEWSNVDKDIQKEIKEVWKEIIKQSLNRQEIEKSIRFICKEVFTCPEGAWIGQNFVTFTDKDRLEFWLKENTGKSPYTERSLIGCEI